MTERAKLVIVGGPNGAGKTTLALRLVEDWKLAYLGADAVAAELGLGSEGADAVRAGREFLERVRVAVERRTSILVETTLSGLGTSRLIDQARGAGYSITVVFVFVDSARVSELRIEDRVRKGGHHVSARDVERRFPRSLSNFWHVYREKADRWRLLYNGGEFHVPVAAGQRGRYLVINPALFEKFLRLVEVGP